MNNKEEYIDFIKGQMKYFDNKSIKEKRNYYLYSIVSLVANAMIPILTTFSSMPSPYKQIVASLSAIAAIANGLSMIMNSGKNWKHYRDTFTDLESVLRAYSVRAGSYNGLDEETAFDKFYENCEYILKMDRESWEIGTAKAKG